MTSLFRVLLLPYALIGALAGTAAGAQGLTSSLAQPEPEIPIIWLAPPPQDVAPEDQRLAIATLLVAPPPNPNAVALPPAARALLEQAMAKGSADSFAAVEKLARATYPSGGAQIDAIAAENSAKIAEKKAADARAKADALAAASFLDNWKGEVDLGGSYTTGVTDAIALYGALKLNKEGLHWRHAFSGRVDYAKSAGVLSTDKDTAAYQPQYKLNDRLYAYGLGQFDRDEILGFSYRFTESAGFGYTVFPGSKLHLDLEAGPAVRETRYIGSLEGDRETRLAGRGSVNFAWKPNPNVTLTEVSAIYFERSNSNITSTTSLDTKLFGPLKVRFSYNITYEQDTPTEAKSLDTITTASVVYSF